jgi:hypothetical protein
MKRLLLLFLFLPLSIHAQEKLEEQWCSLLLEGATVGLFHQTSWRTAEGLLRSEIEQTMEIRRFGVPFFMTQTDVWIEEQDGSLVSVSSELDMNGQGRQIRAEVAGEALRVRVRRGADSEEVFLPFEERPRGLFAVGQETMAMIRGGNAEGELEYRLFSTETMKIEKFSLRVLGPGELSDSLGRVHRGVLVEEQGSSLPGIVTTEVYSEEAKFLYSKTPVGLELEILRLEGEPRKGKIGSPAAEPGTFPGEEPPEEAAAVFDVASLTVPVAGLDGLSLDGTEVLRIRFRGKGVPILRDAVLSAEKDLAPPNRAAGAVRAGTGEQGESGSLPLRIVSTKEDARGEVRELVLRLASVTVADGGFRFGSGPVPPEMQRYLKGGFHLSLADPRLARLQDRCGARDADGGGTADRTDTVLCLEQLVDRYIQNKSLAYGFAGLEEVLSNREGDCTEHALLLVALLRKSGIPSRLAYGLILTEVGFIGHAWVEAYGAGRWNWLDPSFPGGRPYGLKIRLGVMDPAEPFWASLSLTLLQVVSSVQGEILEAGLQ